MTEDSGSGAGIVIAGLISAISLYAVSEGIELAENTARTAYLLEARRKSKME
jgi:hypothetical protein